MIKRKTKKTTLKPKKALKLSNKEVKSKKGEKIVTSTKRSLKSYVSGAVSEKSSTEKKKKKKKTDLTENIESQAENFFDDSDLEDL